MTKKSLRSFRRSFEDNFKHNYVPFWKEDTLFSKNHLFSKNGFFLSSMSSYQLTPAYKSKISLLLVK